MLFLPCLSVREGIAEMQSVARQGLGEEISGGFFGLGAKKTPEAELQTQMRELYASTGKYWNEYLAAANEDLALQFDRFEAIKV